MSRAPRPAAPQGPPLQELLDAIPVPVFFKDVDGVYRGCNRAFEAATGIRREELVGKTGSAFHASELVEEHRRFDDEVLTTGEPRVYETDVRYKDGTTHRVIMHKAVIETFGDLPRGVIGSMIDITAHRGFEQALQASERNYRELSAEFQAILEGLPDALTLWSADRRVVWTNHNARKFFLVDADKVIGRCCEEICMLSGDCQECVVAGCLAGGRQAERIARAQNGRTWSLKGFPLKNRHDQVVKVLTLATDITESLRLREEARRSAHLAALGELAAGVAHEINNPTGLILINIPLVRDVLEDLWPLLDRYCREHGDLRLGGLGWQRLRGELPEVVDEVYESAQRIKQIVEDLKDFARVPDSSRFNEVNLNEVARRAVRLLANAIRKATDHFVADYAEDLPPVRGIAQRLEQVVVNLLMNACQALASRSDSITLAVYHDAPRRVCCVRIWDEGCGIDPAVLAQVTDPFFTTKREQGGTGLGLSVSTRIIDEHQGRLHIDSRPGQGTTVTLELPAVTEGAP